MEGDLHSNMSDWRGDLIWASTHKGHMAIVSSDKVGRAGKRFKYSFVHFHGMNLGDEITYNEHTASMTPKKYKADMMKDGYEIL